MCLIAHKGLKSLLARPIIWEETLVHQPVEAVAMATHPLSVKDDVRVGGIHDASPALLVAWRTWRNPAVGDRRKRMGKG